MKKRLLALLLAVLVVSSFLTIGAAAADYSSNWWEWSQGATDYSVMKSGCRLVAQSKLLAEAGIVDDASFDPDDYFIYMRDNNFIVPGKISEYLPSGKGMIAYAASKGVTIERVEQGKSIRGMSLQEQRELLMSYINQGYYIIVDGDNNSDHQLYVMQYNSQYYGTPWVSDSSSGSKTATCKEYVDYYRVYNDAGGYTNYPFTSIYVYRVVGSGTPVDPTPAKPDAPDASVVSFNFAAETISYDSGKYEVSASDFGAVIPDGGSITSVLGSISSPLYVRVKAVGNTPASDATRVTVPNRLPTPMFVGDFVDYASETFPTDGTYQYSLDNSTWHNCSGATPISVAAAGSTVYFRKAATDSAFASGSSSFTVPTRPAAPTGLEATDESVDKRDDGSISGVTAAMQYRIQGGAWADCPEGTISGLADGSYEIRFKATNSALASEIAALTVNKGVPQTFTLSLSAPEFEAVTYNYAQPAAKPLTITSSGNTDSAISSVTSSSAAFVIGKGSETVPYGASISDWTIQPAAGLEAGTYTATVTVAYNNGATATDTVSIVVNKAPQAAPGKPELAKRDYTSIELKPLAPNANGAVAQYRIDGGEWQTSPVFKDLKAGTDYTFEQRYAAVGSYLASPASESVKFSTESYNIKPTHEIVLEVSGSGEADTNLSNASELSNIIITATPDEGYTVGSVKVTGADGAVEVKRVSATEYRFIMPDGEVEVEVSFVREALPFADVARGSWYYDAVEYVYANGLMEGTSAAAFEPDANMTRAMVWAVLARIDGETISGAGWASDARAWAMESGVSDGTDPNGLITREQLVTMLYRFAGEPEHGGSLSAYADAKSVSSWAAGAMAWAVEEGVISGVTSTTLEPQSTATRAQCAAVLMRFDMR